MATVDVPSDGFVCRIEAYYYKVKVTKFELPTAYRFSTAEGRTRLWADSTPPGLFRVNKNNFLARSTHCLSMWF